MAFFKPVQYKNNPDGKVNSEGVYQNIKRLIDSFFGQDVAFMITFIKPSANTLDAQVEVYDPDYINEVLCLRQTLMASSFSKERIAVAGGQDPQNQNYVPGVSRL